MKINLSDVTINSSVVLKYLDSYLVKMSHHANFDENMLIKVFVNSRGDFTAFEAKDYRLEFTSSAHKLIETIKSTKILDYVTFKEFRSHVDALLAKATA